MREDGTHFAVAPNEKHFEPEVELVVEQYQRYWVVEKLGETADVAEDLEPS